MSIRALGTCALIAFCINGQLSMAQDTPSAASMPQRITIGQNTYFDFGPPFNYYEIYVLESKMDQTAVERITISPPGDACLQPSKVETAAAVLPQSLSQLLGNKSPCSIPENVLRHEAKRCKHCLNFSGAKIAMQVACGGKDRLIPFDVLESDWFEKKPNTPQQTAQILQILSSLNSALRPGVMDQPMFSTGDSVVQPPAQTSSNISELASGKFDTLFPKSSDIPSELYKQSQVPHRPPSVTLAKVFDLAPLDAKLPSYPPIARAAHIQGDVALRLEVTPDGSVSSVSADGGPEMLRAGAIASAKTWTFPKRESSQSVHADIAYRLNCSDVTISSSILK